MLKLTRSSQHYQPLPLEEHNSSTGHLGEDELVYEKIDSQIQKPATTKSMSMGLKFLYVASIICSAVNFIILASDGAGLFFTKTKPQSTLRRPSTYIGLDKLNFPYQPEQLPVIYTFPEFMSQISSREPSKVFLESVIQPKTRFGEVYPEMRRFYVEPQINTLAQFRVADWGMEQCTLLMVLPPAVSHFYKDYKDDTSSVDLNIWKLSTDSELNTARLSWNTRPVKKEFFGRLQVKQGQNSSLPPFHCESGSLLSFEIGYVDNVAQTGDFKLDLVQDTNNPRTGLILVQNSSV